MFSGGIPVECAILSCVIETNSKTTYERRACAAQRSGAKPGTFGRAIAVACGLDRGELGAQRRDEICGAGDRQAAAA